MKPHELLSPEIHAYQVQLKRLTTNVLVLFTILLGLSLAINEFNRATDTNTGTYVY